MKRPRTARIPGSGLSRRVTGALARSGITDKGELFSTSGAQLVAAARIGPEAFAELWDFVRDCALDCRCATEHEPIATPDPPVGPAE